MTYTQGDHFIVNDRTRSWADGEEGVVLITIPPGAETPDAYETLVAGRPLRITESTMQPVTEEVGSSG